jgi:hypothetical protein
MKPAYLSVDAELDLLQQVLWYEQERAGLGEHFRIHIDSALEQIERSPQLGALYGTSDKRRFRVPKPYQRFSVVYVEEEATVKVISIWSNERDPRILSMR